MSDKNIENPDNLPVIEETSLHKIVVTVKLSQEFFSIWGDNDFDLDVAKQYFKQKYDCYSKQNPDDLVSICYHEFYDHAKGIFTLISKPANSTYVMNRAGYSKATDSTIDSKFKIFYSEYDNSNYVHINQFLVVLTENKNHSEEPTSIYSMQAFYWKCWDLNEVVYEENYSYLDKPEKIIKYNFEIKFFNQADFGKIKIGKMIPIELNSTLSFNNSVDFSSIIFENVADFSNSEFYQEADFSTEFKHKVIFDNIKFFGKTKFNDANLIASSSFKSCIFRKDVDFTNAKIKVDTSFCNSVFEDRVDFSGVKFDRILDLDSTLFKGDVKIESMEASNNIDINLQNSTFEKKLFFSLKDDTKENYEKVTLNLYHASIQDFVCDDRNLGKIKLSMENLSKKDLENKNTVEKAIAERRVFRKILQDLNWGDLADLEYAKIMELQTDLKEDGFNKLFSKKIFGWWLGWGVRILPDFHTDSWSNFWKFFIEDFKKGGIVLSSFTLLLFYMVLHLLKITIIKLCPDPETFRIINLIFTADSKDLFESIVVVTGFIQLNFFTVILARKFMRM